MHRIGNIMKLTISLLLMLGAMLVLKKQVQAALYNPVTVTKIEIDGTNYGSIDNISGINNFSEDGFPVNNMHSHEKISISREFVTEPSLYLWAKKRMKRKSDPKDIHLVVEDEDGNVIKRQVLQLCQPLSWSMESTNSSLGGFNETIDIAVQKISKF